MDKQSIELLRRQYDSLKEIDYANTPESEWRQDFADERNYYVTVRRGEELLDYRRAEEGTDATADMIIDLRNEAEANYPGDEIEVAGEWLYDIEVYDYD